MDWGFNVRPRDKRGRRGKERESEKEREEEEGSHSFFLLAFFTKRKFRK